jgi:Ala-tRNA(Pro) deacylase
MMSIRSYLEAHQVLHEVLLHRPVSCASRRAHGLSVKGRTVAKSVLLDVGGQHWLAVLPATHRIDLDRLRRAPGLSELQIATPADLAARFRDCELGAVPPFGRLYDLPVVVDASLGAVGSIVCETNFRHQSVRIRYRDFESLERPLKARFAVHSAPPQKLIRRSCAG